MRFATADNSLATFGGGCFWCLEAAFERLSGVVSVVSGYAGGDDENPSYRSACAGGSGHAEVAQVVFDPTQISYRDLLEVFLRSTIRHRSIGRATTSGLSIVRSSSPILPNSTRSPNR